MYSFIKRQILFQGLLFLLLFLASGTVAASEYEAQLRQERQQKDHDIRLEQIGPFTAFGQESLKDGKAMRVAVRPDTLLLDLPTADVGIPTLEVTWKRNQGSVYVRIPMGGQFHVGRRRVGPVPMQIQPGDTIRAGRFLLQVYRGAKTARLMAFDPSHRSRLEFRELNYFPIDKKWAVEALVEHLSEPDTVAMTTSLGLTKYYLRHSRLHFTTPVGIDQSLTLFVPVSGEEYGFLPFSDATSGGESYGGGRYIDLEPPEKGQKTMIVDFNRAYNPYCAYTHFYNCPIPPEENQLSVAVEAGEKVYK